MDKLSSWSDTWKLNFHPEKCKVLRLGTQNVVGNYKLSDKVLESTNCEKDLGVWMDNNLSFRDHIKQKVSKATQLAGMIRRSFEYLDGPMFKQLFVTFVRPHLEYADSVWAPWSKELQKSIEQVQRTATRQLPGFNKLGYKDRLKKLGLPSLSYRRKRSDMIQVWKMLNEWYDKDSCPKLTQAPGIGYTRGHSLKLQMPKCSTKLRQNFFSSRIVSEWNNLTDDLVKSASLNIFKRKLDVALESDMYNYNE